MRALTEEERDKRREYRREYKRAYWAARYTPRTIEKVCVVCGATFMARWPNQVACPVPCRHQRTLERERKYRSSGDDKARKRAYREAHRDELNEQKRVKRASAREAHPRPCVVCSATLTGRRRLYCSRACAHAGRIYRRREQRPRRVCLRCSALLPLGSRVAYCPDPCRREALHERRQKSRAYYDATREVRRQKSRAYYLAHREEMLEKARAYRASHPKSEAQRELVKQRARAYYLANKDLTKERVRAWRLANPERVHANRRAAYQAKRELWVARAMEWARANRERAAANRHRARLRRLTENLPPEWRGVAALKQELDIELWRSKNHA